ncbi:peptide chain release factor N(5)-glutamine methyltransferase [Pedobacter sp. Leaf132]|uniref:peptide chain release factor N(5)-glutamine methyltransferase n=1 Tax=Pedobacter sp. Leaf132 TaxID=2876557 RepID=UPI001E35D373|nr:peptide chain release factor N(5)-glutamine methyltransferase [Pedobacter sp. Leaf132]
MNIKDLEKEYLQSLKDLYGAEEAKALFILSTSNIVKLTQSEILLKQDKVITVKQSDKLLKILEDLKMGKPIQHILGEAYFYNLPFRVNENVLVPRPETEELVDWIVTEVKQTKKSLIDIGTGSGCIAVSLKKNLSHLDVSALDVSEKALTVAQENANLNQAEINFIEADILSYTTSETYDIIVSNPPYIRELEKADMHQNVLEHEPHRALFVSNENPLIFYNAIADFALTNLNPNGYLFFEINEFLWAETLQILIDKQFKNIELRKDMQGKDRMIMARTNP